MSHIDTSEIQMLCDKMVKDNLIYYCCVMKNNSCQWVPGMTLGVDGPRLIRDYHQRKKQFYEKFDSQRNDDNIKLSKFIQTRILPTTHLVVSKDKVNNRDQSVSPNDPNIKQVDEFWVEKNGKKKIKQVYCQDKANNVREYERFQESFQDYTSILKFYASRYG